MRQRQPRSALSFYERLPNDPVGDCTDRVVAVSQRRRTKLGQGALDRADEMTLIGRCLVGA
jgi:hypothetical protein